jgi:hypothetical protein
MEANTLSAEQLKLNRLAVYEPLATKLGVSAALLAELPPDAIAALVAGVRMRSARKYYQQHPELRPKKRVRVPKSSSATEAVRAKTSRVLLTVEQKKEHRAVIQSRYHATHRAADATNNQVWCAANRERINNQRRLRRAAAKLQAVDAQ